MEVPIKKGYQFVIDGDEKYREFRGYFKIGGGKGVFSIKDFRNNLSRQIPTEYQLNDHKRRVILRYDKLDNGSNGIYPIGVTNWEVVHVKNTELPKDKYHRTSNNLMKTKELYPKIYEATKNLDLTIIYGENTGEKTELIKAGKW